jgi:plasmid maintenance system antidote protein VapI
MTNLGAILTLYCRVNNVGLRELAAELDTSKATMSRFMNGHDVSQDVMLKLINWLFTQPHKQGDQQE